MRISTKILISGLWLVVAFPLAANAQFFDRLVNPKVTVTLTHPPQLGLEVKRVAFGPVSGQCADQLLDGVVADFVNSRIDVIDRHNLESILAEHRFNLTEYVDPASAAALGKILGPSALVLLKVQRCVTEKKPLYKDWADMKGVPHRTHISRTQAYFRASIQTIDLATARIFTAKNLEASPLKENESESCCPEFPSEYDLLDQAQAEALTQIHRMFFPWTETRSLYFFDDKECNLKAAFQLLRGGDLPGTLRQSEENLASCRQRTDVKPKIVWHALYNVGMAHFALDNHDKALEFFAQASQSGGGSIVAESMAECRRAQQLASEMRRVEERAAIVAAQAPASVSTRTSPPTAGTTLAAGRIAGGGSSAASVEERLKKLDELLKKGLITKAEYDKKRAAILNDI